MKVLLAYQPGELRVVEMEKPVPGPHEVLAKVAHCGVCATDVSIMRGTLNLGEGNEPVYPVRLGHEWSGTVVEAGSETWNIRVGDRIVSDTGYFCGECYECLHGQYQSCRNGKAIGTTGHCWPGAFAEYMLIPERMAYRIPDNVSMDEATLIEPSAIGLYGLTRTNMGPDTNLLVVGTGPIGLGGMACAKGLGVGRTILAGRKDQKLEIGRQMGAAVLVNTTKESLFDGVMRETNGRGMDIIMDTTGDVKLFNDLLAMLKPSGYFVIPAFYERTLDGVMLDRLIARNCTLVGAAGTTNMVPKLLGLLSNGHMSLKEMITDRYDFDHVMDAFAAAGSKGPGSIKIMVDFE